MKYIKNLKSYNILSILIAIRRNPGSSQRILAQKLGFSLGKFNYILSALKQKGLIKFKNFKKNKKKLNYIYILTPKGIEAKSELAINFLKLKMKEYDEIKKEIKEDKLQ
jgi:EPS-associated MarR family transcriptional regulator